MIYYGFQNTPNESKVEIFVRADDAKLSVCTPGFHTHLAKEDETMIVTALSRTEGVKLIEGWCML